ncbi:helix-turn-helix domain-containing protein (plasmid) [Rhizobium sp. CC1099]|uniref:helix-turn-helix domain-containing protein n=1 Tax=Rhizobium sp. CC1099 TaxID=3039160 RepID=UPI0024B128D6|nr:helix-turn-helix domain-containing protein [Rhizobium sp. CC1099]WFU91989.1 helix-turn-helix domain-containing protein [Rhizobium sp. CC1099]
MRSSLWQSFETVSELVTSGDFTKVAEKVDSAINASMETVADVLPTAAAPILRAGAAAATGALNKLRSTTSANRLSPDYAAGRLAAAVDILGYAAYATADDEAVKKARQQPYARILDLLAGEPLRNTDIVVKLRRDKAYVSRLLDELRGMEMVTSHRHGRDLFNALTPVGRLVVEEGVEARQRAPLAQSKVVALRVFDLGNLPTPSGTKQSQLPRLSAAGYR